MPDQSFNFLLHQQAAIATVAGDDDAINPIDFLFQEAIKHLDHPKEKY